MNINGMLANVVRVTTSREGLKGLLSIPLYANAGYLVADTVIVSPVLEKGPAP